MRSNKKQEERGKKDRGVLLHFCLAAARRKNLRGGKFDIQGGATKPGERRRGEEFALQPKKEKKGK